MEYYIQLSEIWKLESWQYYDCSPKASVVKGDQWEWAVIVPLFRHNLDLRLMKGISFGTKIDVEQVLCEQYRWCCMNSMHEPRGQYEWTVNE
jgi:hypothetical protein